MDALFPMPDSIKQRAWECAFDLMHGGSRVPTGVREAARLLVSDGVEGMRWATARLAFRLYRQHYPART